MKKSVKIAIMLMAIVGFSLILFRLNLGSCQTTTLKIVDATTGSSSITLGNAAEPIPKEGIPFTVKVILDGGVSNLMTFQVGISYNPTAINYIKAWFPKGDPNFIFYGKTNILESPVDIVHISVEQDEIVLGAMLLDPSSAVTTDSGILCMINFTAKKAGTYEINFASIGMDTFLLDNSGSELNFQTQGFTLTVLGSNAPLASFTWTPRYPSANETVIFNASGSYDPDGYIVSYIWDFGDGIVNETSNPIITHNFTRNGIYNVNLTVIDDSALSDFLVQSVMVGRPPILILEPINPKYNLTDTITFNASGSYDPDGYIVSYIWDFGDGHNETTSDPIILKSYEKRGIFNILLTIVDDDGLSNSTSLKVQIGNSPKANFTYAPKNPQTWDTVTFDATGTQIPDGVPIETFVWYFEERNETIIKGANEPTIDYYFMSDSGGSGWNVTLTVYDEDGLYDSCSAFVSVTAPTQMAGFGMEIPITVAIIIVIIAAVVIKKIRSKEEEALEI